MLIRSRALRAEQRANGFLLRWTRKEAYIKDRGEGLQIPLNSFDVSLTGEPAKFSRGVDSFWHFCRSYLGSLGGSAGFQGQSPTFNGSISFIKMSYFDEIW
jgi:hypothetical protein